MCFHFFSYSTLEYISDKTLFITYCFVIRGFEALGASAYSTASYVFVVNTFPQHIGSVLVSSVGDLKKKHAIINKQLHCA